MLSSGDQGSFPKTWITEEKMGPAGLGGIVAAVSASYDAVLFVLRLAFRSLKCGWDGGSLK